MVIKYRISNNDTNMTTGAIFASTTASGRAGARGNGGDNKNTASPTTLYADGEWHYLVITPNAENTPFVANENGTYSWAYLRITTAGFAATDGSCYIDIDEIAFADNQEAVDAYIAQ